MEQTNKTINSSGTIKNILAIAAAIIGTIGIQFIEVKYLPIVNKMYATVILTFCASPLGFAFLLPKSVRWYSLALLPLFINLTIEIDRSKLKGPLETCDVIEAYIPGHLNKETTTYSNPIAHIKCGELDLTVHVGDLAFYTAEKNHLLSKYEGRLGFEYYE
jgi:hypothetical protein